MAQTQLRTEQIVPGDYPHYIQEPYDGGLNAMTAALLHFNSNFTDETGNIWTPASACPTGTAGIDTGIYQFGGGSLYLKSNPTDQGDYITTPFASKYNIGSNDFAIEFWINKSRVVTTGNGLVLGINDYSYPFYDASAGRTGWCLYSITDVVKFAMNGYEFIGGGPFNPGDNNWHHIAVCRQGNLFSSYYDGVRNATGTSSNPVLDASGTVLSFGQGSGGVFYGEICGNYDELRLTVGSCIYSGTSFSLSENLTEEFYKDVAIIGVTTESTNTDGNIPRWTVTGTQLSNGLGLVTTLGVTGSNSNIPSEKAVRDAIVSGTATTLSLIPSQTGTFLTLTDTPDSYGGYGGYFVKVKGDASGLEFGTGTSGGGGGSVATDTIWDAKGDLAVASASDSASRLAVGTNGYILMADSAQTLGVKWAFSRTSGVTLFSDTFDRADSAVVGAPTGTGAVGEAPAMWKYDGNNIGDWGITSNLLAPKSSQRENMVLWEIFPYTVRYVLTVTMTTKPGDGGIMVKFNSMHNGLLLHANTGTKYTLYNYVNGGYTQVATGSTQAPTSGDVIEVTCTGTKTIVKVNGTIEISHYSHYIGGNLFGFRENSSTTARWNDLSVVGI